MNLKQTIPALFLATAFLPAAQAAEVGQHPAVFAPRQLPAVDPSTFLVGHPAGLALRSGHANHEHPAVTNKAARPTLDIGRYLVQPPSTTRWKDSGGDFAPTLARAPVAVIR